MAKRMSRAAAMAVEASAGVRERVKAAALASAMRGRPGGATDCLPRWRRVDQGGFGEQAWESRNGGGLGV